MQYQEVLERGRINSNTLRKYVYLGLIPNPTITYSGFGGSESSYAEDTVNRLEKIERYKAEGKTLAEIQQIFAHDSPNISSTEIITNYLNVIADKLKTQLKSIVDTSPVGLAEKRVVANRLECVQWQIQLLQQPKIFKKQIERNNLSEQLRSRWEDL